MTDPFRDLESSLGVFSAAKLQAMEFPPINWIVPDVLPEGLTILAGKPKLGKSWLALDAALAVANGGNVLGHKCPQGPALYLALEDNQRRLQRRLNRIEPHGAWPEALELHTRWPRFDRGGLERIEQWIRSREGARLVIVDTLAVVRPVQKSSETAHASDYAALRGLHQLAGEHGIAVLVVHHLRKADAEDPFDAVSGSTGLTGAADSTLILTRRDSDSGVVLYGRGRDLEEFEAGLEFDALTSRWRDVGDPVEAFASDTRAAIFAAIREGHSTPGQIARETGLSDANVRQTLGRMVRACDLRKDGRGLYSITSDSLGPPSQQSQRHNGGGEDNEFQGVKSPVGCDSNQTSESQRHKQSDNVTDVTGGHRANGRGSEAWDPEMWK